MKQNAAKLKESLGGIGAWVHFAVRERKFIYLAIAALVALGAAGLLKMNKDEFPAFQLKQGLVVGVYPGATAAEVEEQLAKPLEETLFSYNEVDRGSLSTISKDGMCFIYADLNVAQEKKDEVWSKIKLGLQARKMTLPAGVLAITVLDDFSHTSSLLIAVESDDKSFRELREYADDICEELRRIPTLARASALGGQEEEIAVTIDREKLSGYGIDPAALLLSYQTSALPIGGGTFSTGYTSSPIHLQSTVSDEKEVGDYIVYADPSGDIIRLKDVARIERRMKEPDSHILYNGHNCLILNVEMRPDNDITAFGEEVDAVLERCASRLPDSVRMSRITDQPKVVSGSIWSFLRDLVISIAVVIGVMLMLFPLRSALIASTSVPVCTALAIGVMYLTGMELNTVTLAALIVVLGMIVDDSVITMDGYMDKTSRGLQGADAAAASAQELFIPTFVATLAICLMFFPIKGIITGYLGDFVKLFPWVILISLMASLFYAVTVVPSLEVRFIRTGGAGKEKKNLFARMQDKFFDGMQRIYETGLEWCFRHPRVTLAGGVAAVALGLLMFSQLNLQMMPKANRDMFVIEMYTEGGDGLERTRAYADSMTALLRADGRVKSVTAFVGTGAPRFNATYTPILPSPQMAQLIVNTTSSDATVEMLKEYENRYEHLFPSVRIHFKQMDYQAVEAPIEVKFLGGDRQDMKAAADQLTAYMRTMDTQLKWVHSDCDDFTPAVSVSLDADEAGRLGVSKALAALSLSGSFGGRNIATLWENGVRLPVNLYTEGINDTMDYHTVNGQLIATAIPGVSVPLRQIATVEPEWTPRTLNRYAGQDEIAVTADLKSGVSQPAAEKRIKAYVDKEIRPNLPPGVSVEYAGLSSTNKQVMPEIGLSFAAAVAILFLFLLFHFKKTSIATLTLTLSLICLFGASFGLWIFGLDFSITAVLGLISLVGIIVRNGILMFEYAEEERFKRGVPVREAAMEAGKRRMRPIFLTSCTTALGVLPMIISGDLLWMPMGVVICFGTMLSIALIVLIMPVSYWQLFQKN